MNKLPVFQISNQSERYNGGTGAPDLEICVDPRGVDSVFHFPPAPPKKSQAWDNVHAALLNMHLVGSHRPSSFVISRHLYSTLTLRATFLAICLALRTRGRHEGSPVFSLVLTILSNLVLRESCSLVGRSFSSAHSSNKDATSAQ